MHGIRITVAHHQLKLPPVFVSRRTQLPIAIDGILRIYCNANKSSTSTIRTNTSWHYTYVSTHGIYCMVWFNRYVCIMTNYKNSSVVAVAAAAAVAQQCFRFYPSSFSHFSFTLIQHVLRCSINAAHHTNTNTYRKWCVVTEILFVLLHRASATSICVCRICARRKRDFECNAEKNSIQLNE